MGIQRIRAELSEAERYLDLRGVHRDRAREVLRAAQSADSARDLRDKAKLAASYVDCYRDWLEERGYITHHNRPTPEARPAKEPQPTEKGRGVILVGEAPSLSSLTFEVDGGYRGTVTVGGREKTNLDADQAATIMNQLNSGKCITVGGPPLHANELGELTLRYEMERSNEKVEEIEREMWRFIKNALLTTTGVDDAGEARINRMLPHPPAYWLPLELNWSPDSRYLADLYNEYWKKRLEHGEHERGSATLIPQTPEEDPFSGHLFSVEEGVGGSGGALDSLKLGNIPRSVIKEFEEMDGCSIPEDAGMRFVKRGMWEIPDSTPSCRIVSEGNDRLDVYEAGGPYPESGWKVRRNILRKMKNLVGESEECRKWLEGRLERDPNFFMPASFWRKLGFNIGSEGTGRVSLPYNTEPREPKFLSLLSTGLLYVFDAVAKRWGEGSVPSTGKLQEESVDFSKTFSDFVERLEDLQEEEEFYELWSVLRGMSGTRFTEDRLKKWKNIKIFDPIEEAALRYYCEGELTDLSKAYSDLSEGRKNSIEELREAIGKGEYDL